MHIKNARRQSEANQIFVQTYQIRNTDEPQYNKLPTENYWRSHITTQNSTGLDDSNFAWKTPRFHVRPT